MLGSADIDHSKVENAQAYITDIGNCDLIKHEITVPAHQMSWLLERKMEPSASV